MNHKLITLLVFLIYISCYPQTIKIAINGIDNDKTYLFFLVGEKTFLVDSINSTGDDNFSFSFESINNHFGFYRLSFNNKKFLDFVCDREDIEIKTDANNIVDSLKVIKSGSNKIYYQFVKLNKDYKTKIELLQLILARYPKDDDYYQTTKERLFQIQEEYNYFVNVTAQANPNSFIARYVRSAQLTLIDDEILLNQQLNYLKIHSLDNLDFYDEELIYSDVFTNKTIEYLSYYRNPQFTLELLEKEFHIAIDTILSKAKVNEKIYAHIVEYLLDGFKKYGFDNVINYIVENYVIKDDLCLNEKLTNTLERRIQQTRILKIGKVVQNIILPDSSGNLIDLYNIYADSILIVFYASWCPHCQKLLPQVYDLYKIKQENNFEVLAVSIDTSRTEWLNFIETNNLNWMNVSDLEGWNGQATLDYYIYATPTMFLVDKQLRLIAKPSSIEELNKCF